MQKIFSSSFLEGARKEAKELLAKFNARNESRSLMSVDFCTERALFWFNDSHRVQKSKVPSFIAFPFAHPPKFRPHTLRFEAAGGLLIRSIKKFIFIYHIHHFPNTSAFVLDNSDV
jgi:hypothetical protein